MPLTKNAMGGGVSAGTAQALNGTVAPTVSAAGTVQTDATTLNADINIITTCAAGAGVIVFNGEIGDDQWVYNATDTNQLTVYPPTNGQFNQLAANTGVMLSPYTGCLFKKFTSTKWTALLSA